MKARIQAIALVLILVTLVISAGGPWAGNAPAAAQGSAPLGASICDTVSEIPAAECDALVALYNSTNGDGWTNKAGWLETNTPCSWYGMTCIGGHVIQLDLLLNNLTGTIPAELGSLANLTTLNLAVNELSGSIPASLGDLASLVELRLSENLLTGAIPPELANLANLESLGLSLNNLNGSIPAELATLENLLSLDLSYNQLSGTIPAELGDTNLRNLILSSNHLSGTIPPELGDLCAHCTENRGWDPELGTLCAQQINLSSNDLEGAIPPELGTLDSCTEFLDLSSNHLTGDIPEELGTLYSLFVLDLSGNQLTGNIPDSFQNLTSLVTLGLSNNQLGGNIPTWISHLTNLWRDTGLDIGYDMFSASNYSTWLFVSNKDLDWEETQTVPPRNVQVAAATPTSVELAWTPILYTGDGGYYEVSYAETPGGPHIVSGTTADKSVSGYTVDGLAPRTTYYFVVRTFTPAHGLQQSALLSPYSDEVEATTSGLPYKVWCPIFLVGE